MVEPKISLSLLVPGAKMLSSQECEENPKKNYDEFKISIIKCTKGKGKNQKTITEPMIVKVRKQKLVTQNINICEEAYNYMLSTPTSEKLNKVIKHRKGKAIRAWDTFSINEKLKHHFDLIAHDLGAVSYHFEVLDD